MALNADQLSKPANLKPASGSAKQTRSLFWYEAGADAIAAVVTAGYFNGVRAQLAVGDRIQVVCNNEADFRVLKVTAVPIGTANVTTAALAVVAG
ncbi:MAG: hypothetical protein ACK4FB_09095 [Brevundimonas sp.]|uniref:hypothetical protein n=1 Tax=Brevundimonas sp. TaxID=1871086 RepID=UPI00391ADC0E